MSSKNTKPTKGAFLPKAGTCWPDEYDWVGQFSELDPAAGFVPLDAGKVYGLTSAYAKLLTDAEKARRRNKRKLLQRYLDEPPFC